MADNFLSFSEVIPNLAPEEEAWLRKQLEVVYVFGDREYAEDELPAELDAADADWSGCRAWRDLEDYDPDDGETVGFQYAFHEDHDTPDGWGRHLWVYTEEWGSPGRAAHLVRKFLKDFRPDQCWMLTYALTCSKPRAGEFGGGGIFVTASEIKCQDSRDFVEAQAQAFGESLASPEPEGEGLRVVRRWVLYDLDGDALLTTNVYDSYDEAVEAAQQVDDVLVLPIVCKGLHV